MAWVTGRLREVGSQNVHSLSCKAEDVYLSDRSKVADMLDYLDTQEANLLIRQIALTTAVANLTEELKTFTLERQVITSSETLTAAVEDLTEAISDTP